MAKIDTTDKYIDAVLANLPPDFPDRNQIAGDLKSHIEDRVKSGMTLAEVLQRMGSPVEVAESFDLQSYIVYGSYERRLGSFLIDAFIFFPIIAIEHCLTVLSPMSASCGFIGSHGIYINAVLVVGYFPILEYFWGCSLGKMCFGLQVRGVKGERITILQALVRRLPFLWLSNLWLFLIDAVGILITPRRQRFTDLIAKTVVIQHKKISSRRYWLSWLLALLVVTCFAISFLKGIGSRF